jgi:hypothetical protein
MKAATRANRRKMADEYYRRVAVEQGRQLANTHGHIPYCPVTLIPRRPDTGFCRLQRCPRRRSSIKARQSAAHPPHGMLARRAVASFLRRASCLCWPTRLCRAGLRRAAAVVVVATAAVVGLGTAALVGAPLVKTS